MKSQPSFTHHPKGRKSDCSSLKKNNNIKVKDANGLNGVTAFLSISLLCISLPGIASQQISTLVWFTVFCATNMLGQLMQRLEVPLTWINNNNKKIVFILHYVLF